MAADGTLAVEIAETRIREQIEAEDKMKLKDSFRELNDERRKRAENKKKLQATANDLRIKQICADNEKD